MKDQEKTSESTDEQRDENQPKSQGRGWRDLPSPPEDDRETVFKNEKDRKK